MGWGEADTATKDSFGLMGAMASCVAYADKHAKVVGARCHLGCGRSSRAGMVAGCSSSSDDASDETGGEETSQVLPPVIVEPGQTEATAKVGDFIDIVVDEVLGTTISTDNSDVLEIYQARQDGDAIFNPGAKALAAGDATITVTLPDNTGYDIAVTVTE